MRRKDKEIAEAAVLRKILNTAKHVTIALCRDNQPYLVTLSHGYDEKHNCIYFHCGKEGKKLDYLRSNNTVWGQAMLDYGYVEDKCDHLFATVQFQGQATILDRLEEKRRAVECMIRQLNKKPEPLISKLKTERLESAVFGRIDINYMSGKKSEQVKVL